MAVEREGLAGEVGSGGSAGAGWCLEVTPGTGGPSGLACAGLGLRPGEQLIPLPALALLPGPTRVAAEMLFWGSAWQRHRKGEREHGSP